MAPARAAATGGFSLAVRCWVAATGTSTVAAGTLSLRHGLSEMGPASLGLRLAETRTRGTRAGRRPGVGGSIAPSFAAASAAASARSLAANRTPTEAERM